MHGTAPHRRVDSGQSSPLLLAVVTIAALLAVATARAGVVMIDHQRARTAADAAALAAAEALASGDDVPAVAAARLAEANGAVVLEVVADGSSVFVRVERGGVTARARASFAGP